MTGPRQQIIVSLEDRAARDYFVNAHISNGLAFQIRTTREARGWSQQELAERSGKRQGEISRLEDPDYGRYSLTTLRRLAAAFDVALIVRFAPFSQLVDWAVGLSPQDLAVPSFDADEHLTDTGDFRLVGESLEAPVLSGGRVEPTMPTTKQASTWRDEARSSSAGTADYFRVLDERKSA
jgi:transcriptional regulator with XRE-family HTH domain